MILAYPEFRLTYPVPYFRVGHDKPSLALIQGLFANSALEIISG
jgi:hypothetical protein